MKKSIRLDAPLTLTEKVKTPLGSVRIVLTHYQPSGLLSVGLILAETHSQKTMFDEAPFASLSFDLQQPVALEHAEFAAPSGNQPVLQALLDKGLIQATGKVLAGAEIWCLAGSALIEFNSVFAPSITATKASFPSHLFGRKAFNPAGKNMLAVEFEQKGFTKHSAAGESIWVVREHCERNRTPFAVYLVKERNQVISACVCKANLAKSLAARDAAEGRYTEIVYESPRAAGSF